MDHEPADRRSPDAHQSAHQGLTKALTKSSPGAHLSVIQTQAVVKHYSKHYRNTSPHSCNTAATPYHGLETEARSPHVARGCPRGHALSSPKVQGPTTGGRRESQLIPPPEKRLFRGRPPEFRSF